MVHRWFVRLSPGEVFYVVVRPRGFLGAGVTLHVLPFLFRWRRGLAGALAVVCRVGAGVLRRQRTALRRRDELGGGAAGYEDRAILAFA